MKPKTADRSNYAPMGRRVRRALIGIGVVIGVVVVVVATAFLILDKPRPSGSEGPRADQLASRMEEAVDIEAWARTGAVRWTFADRHHHLWDRQRELLRVIWDDTVVLLRLGDRSGRVYIEGREVEGDDARDALDRAFAAWVNDSFWLNPIAMFRGEGVSRATVPLDDGGEGLLIAYSSGGLTPGDAYLWVPGEDGLPRAWRMWVSIIPVGGVEMSWTGWQTLATGARISTRHQGPFGISLELTGVEGAETLAALVDEDPFAPLLSDAG